MMTPLCIPVTVFESVAKRSNCQVHSAWYGRVSHIVLLNLYHLTCSSHWIECCSPEQALSRIFNIFNFHTTVWKSISVNSFFFFPWLLFICLQFFSTIILMFSERQEFLLKLLDTSCPDCPSLPVSLPETVQPIWDYTSRPSRKMGTVKGSKGAIHLCALLKVWH